jgi:hypothetical protein
MRRQCSPCHARMGPIQIPEKASGTLYTDLVFFHPV